MIRGNHDAASQLSKSLRLPDGVFDLSTRKVETLLFDDLGVAIHGRGYPQRDVEDNIAASYPQALPDYFNIGLLHTALDGRDGHAPYAPCKVDDLLVKGYDYWALGHVHQREIIHRDPWIVFPGNLQGRHIRETGAKGAMLINKEDDVITSVEHYPLDVVRWQLCALDISSAASAEAVLEQVHRQLDQAAGVADDRLLVLRLQLTGNSPAHTELSDNFLHWQQQIRALAHDIGAEIWLERIQLQTRSALDLEVLLNDDGPLGGLLRALRSLPGDEAELGRLLAEFEPLYSKLPAEYQQQENALDLKHPDTLRALLQDLDQQLLPMLLGRSGR
jgi:DNA repair exonuclease SbcCD nuclease subunit